MKLKIFGIGLFTDNFFDVFNFKLSEKASKIWGTNLEEDYAKFSRPSQTILAVKNAGVRI